jgi:hypothetical protein
MGDRVKAQVHWFAIVNAIVIVIFLTVSHTGGQLCCRVLLCRRLEVLLSSQWAIAVAMVLSTCDSVVAAASLPFRRCRCRCRCRGVHPHVHVHAAVMGHD